ncbi:MAG TPA: PRC-barrel domain-containing protein [Bacillota bacterium]|nr:PRC-barrel domain-containing protein [Bacillota bacterium]
MHKAKEVIGLPVLDLKTGQELGVVRDVIFNEEWLFSGLFVETKNLFRRGRHIPSDSIHSIGDDCVTVPDQEVLLPIVDNFVLNGIKTGPKSIVGKPLYTTNGNCLGQVEDIYFGEELGEITGYEVSDGLLSDILRGRKSLQSVESCTIGVDAVVIKEPNKREEIT